MVTFSPALLGRLAGASRVAVLTGAGVSAESGVPTFRDAQTGLWARYNPHELATPEAFRANPRLVWEWYEFRRGLVAAARPNPGHVALAALEARYPDFTLATQNVDNLHRTAGSQNVVELHGNLA
ncbi:NAD-dependent protein deacylase, partial [Kouleothrix aurantiaca]